MSSDVPTDGDYSANGDTNGTRASTETPLAPTTTASATPALSKDVENVIYSDVRLSRLCILDVADLCRLESTPS